MHIHAHHLIHSRRALTAAALCFAMVAVAIPPSGDPAEAHATAAAADATTTLDRTIVPKGKKGKKSKKLKYGPGQERVTRSLIKSFPGGKGTPLAAFHQLSDVHTIDEESPARVEWGDRCDPSFSSAYRPQEAMSSQVAETMVQALNSIDHAPGTGAELGFAIATGDSTDNNQFNELRWFIDLLDGQFVLPNSGGTTPEERAASGYEGYTKAESKTALSDDILNRAQVGFDATGTNVPWYGVIGNHDGLAQGTVNGAGHPQFRNVPMSGAKNFSAIEAEKYCSIMVQDSTAAAVAALTDGVENRAVTADPDRRFLTHDEVVAEYFNTATAPVGHGFENAPIDPQFGSTAGYYTFDISEDVIGISMDTIAWSGGASGSLSDPQFQWIEEQLAANSVTQYGPNGQLIDNPDGEDKLIILFSHHTSKTLDNPGTDEAGAPYHCFRPGDAPACADTGFKDLLQRFPNVIAWVNGHEHNNRVTAYKTPKGADATRGFWEINTAAHIDWPQQSRIVEVAYQPGKGNKPPVVIIYGTLFDHAAPLKPGAAGEDDVAYLAAVSRLQSYKDACKRKKQATCGATGKAGHRNVKLIQKAPFELTP